MKDKNLKDYEEAELIRLKMNILREIGETMAGRSELSDFMKLCKKFREDYSDYSKMLFKHLMADNIAPMPFEIADRAKEALGELIDNSSRLNEIDVCVINSVIDGVANCSEHSILKILSETFEFDVDELQSVIYEYGDENSRYLKMSSSEVIEKCKKKE